MRVIVATYEHKHGSDVRVFASDEGADKWARELAATYWDSVMDTEKPADAEKASTEYFEYCSEVGFEFFNTESMEVEA